MTYALADLTLLKPIGARRDAANVVTGPGPDPLTPSQRAAVERKRAVVRERDTARLIRATASLPNSAFSDTAVWTTRTASPQLRSHPIFESLSTGLGAMRRILLVDLWFDEPRRRASRTAHQVIAEHRLAQPSVNKS